MKRLIPLLLLALAMGTPAAGPITAGTVKGFIEECNAMKAEAATDVCTSYLRGALDQAASRGSVQCIHQLDGNLALMEVWLRLSDTAKAKGSDKLPIGSTVRQYIAMAAPACH